MRPLAANPSPMLRSPVRFPPTLANKQIWQKRFYSKPPPKPRRRRIILPSLIVGAGAGYMWDKYYNCSSFSRSIYALSVFGITGVRYYFIDSYTDQNALHEIASESIYKMLMRNKGMYIKLGQAIANQGSVFPEAFQKRFVKLYDDAPVDTWESVDKLLTHMYGKDYENRVFESIDHTPVASASIAQVHKAVLKNGDVVAVKVQHDYISKQVAADMWCYRIVTKLYERLFDIPMTFYTQYVLDQTILETKFIHELENAERIRKCLAEDKVVKNLGLYIPKNYPELSNDTVLVSEWIDGIPLTKKSQLIKERFSFPIIMKQFSVFFGRQIFSYGFVHCDPHPGNLLARKVNGVQQLVILDHGLYVDMNDKFRKEYAQLWRYLLSFDRKGIENIGREWGINSIEMLATSIQMKPVEGMEKRQKVDSKEMMRTFLSDTSKFPLELFFLSRAMRILLTCNKIFGSPINRVNMLTGTALDVLIPHASFIDWLSLLKTKIVLFGSNIVFWVYRLRQLWYGDKYGYKGLGLEDEIERRFKNMAKNMGMPVSENDTVEMIEKETQ